MPSAQSTITTPLPGGWSGRVKSTILHVIALARFSVECVAGDNLSEGVAHPYQARIARLEQKVTILTEMMRVKDQRMARIAAQSRPRYLPIERLEILELKAACHWSLRETGRQFQIAPATVSAWLKRVDEEGPDAILQLRSPVNKFPDLVRYSVSRLKTLCPELGKVKISQILCRAGLHLSASTVGRIVKQASPTPAPNKADTASENQPTSAESTQSVQKATKPIVTAKYPNHVWHVDMTVVPMGGGFWTPWIPFSLPQCWPFCWWVVLVMDHFSRKVIGFAVFKKQPTAIQVRTFLGSAMGRAKAQPKYIISDKGSQFWCGGYKRWCKRKGIKPRFGAIGKHGSIAVIERVNRTFKEFLRELPVVPMNQKRFREESAFFMDWYNEHRPHMTLDGKTPNEVYFGVKRPANRRSRIEPRKKWPRGSPCAKPQTLVAGQPGDRFVIEIEQYQGRKQLPIVSLKRVA